MHPAARLYDAKNRKRRKDWKPPANRPCDVCGVPTGIEGRFVHPFCAIVERTVMQIAAEGKRYDHRANR